MSRAAYSDDEVKMCHKIFSLVRPGGYYVSTMHGPSKSVEEKIASTLLVPYLQKLNQSSRPAPFVLDVGSNDGSDVASWMELAGNGGLVVLVEPQPRYHGNISRAVAQSFTRLCSRQDGSEKVLKFISSPSWQLSDASQVLSRTGRSGKAHSHPLAEDYVVFSPCQRSPSVLYVQGAIGNRATHGQIMAIHGSGEQAKLVFPSGPSHSYRSSPTGRGGSSTTVIALEFLIDDLTAAFRHTIGQAGGGEKMSVHFLKIDAEGADSTILVSSAPLFEQQLVHLVVFELNRNVNKRKWNFPHKLRDAMRMLTTSCYEVFLVGYWHERKSFVLTRLDEGSIVFWEPKLETVVAWPVRLRRAFLSAAVGSTSNDDSLFAIMSPAAVLAFWNASVAKVTSPKWQEKFQRVWSGADRATAFMEPFTQRCFAEHLLVPCLTCGGETPRSWG